MTRTILTVALIVLLNVLVGCAPNDSGRAHLMPTPLRPSAGPGGIVVVRGASETDIIEQVAVNRGAYRQGLELLIERYTRTGNDMKLAWSKRELRGLDTIPKYNYIIEASVAGPNLRASTLIPEADLLYRDAVQFEREARKLIIFTDANLLRLALNKYNQVIRKHPNSDKIDDAAFQAGGIYEHFKDYTIAVLYYERAYQWDPETIYPARFRAAFILDKRLRRRAEALKVYKQAVEKESRFEQWKEFAEGRIRELTKSDEGVE